MTMHDYIYQQPEVLARIVSDRKAIAGEAARFMAEHKPDSICLIASGTSRNAALTASYFMEDVLGIPVTVRAAAAKGHFFGSSLAVFISQSGNSTNTIAAAEKCPVPSFAITGNESGRLNTICSHHILMPCGPEDVGPKTKGYTATIAVLYVMGVSSIKEFALPLMVGIVCGAYSSVCITGALWFTMKTKGMKMSAVNALADKGAAEAAKTTESAKPAEKAAAKKAKDTKADKAGNTQNKTPAKKSEGASAGKEGGSTQAHSVRRYTKNRSQKN